MQECQAGLALGYDLPLLGQVGEAAFSVDDSADEVALLVEAVVDRAVDGGKFLQVSVCRNLSMARSRRRNGRCKFSARLLSSLPVSWRSALPISLMAAP